MTMLFHVTLTLLYLHNELNAASSIFMLAEENTFCNIDLCFTKKKNKAMMALPWIFSVMLLIDYTGRDYISY